MGMYIDNITGSLNAANNTADTLIKQKANDVQQALQQAELLRAMGKNKAAEEMLQKASNTGIAGTLYSLANPAEEWSAKNPFTGQKMDIVEKKGLSALKDSSTLYGGASADQGKILNDLKDAYTVKNDKGQAIGFDKEGYNKQLQLIGQQAQGISAEGALSNVLSTNPLQKELNTYHANQYADEMKSNQDAYKALQADQKLQDQQIAKDNAPLIQANKEAEAYNALVDKENAKRQAYNNSLPSKNLTGNEVDQQGQLISSTMNAIKAGGGMDAYMKAYVTNKAINDHYGHKFGFPPPAYFGLGGTGKGRGAKLKNYTAINPADGKPYQFQVEEGVSVNNKKTLDRVSKELGFTVLPGHYSASGENNNDYANPNMNDPRVQKAAIENNEYYEGKADKIKKNNEGWFSWLDSDETRKEKVTNANKQIDPNSPFVYDDDWNKVYKTNTTTAAAKKPWNR